MHGLGETTQDLRALGIPHPTEQAQGLPENERETRIRRNGTRSIWAGALLLVTDITATLSLMAYARHYTWTDPISRQFVGLTILLTGLAATALLTSGLIERQQRQQRTLIRRAMARADANAELGDANREAIETNNRLVAEAIATLSGIEKRLHALETAVEQVPGYARGVIDGATMRANALGDDDR